jgi:nucleoid-associated protein YgaU
MKRSIQLGLLSAVIALSGTLKAADQAAPAPDEAATLKTDNKQLSDELATAWKESEKLKAELASAQASSAKSTDQAAELQRQLDAIKPSAGTSSDAASQLADVQDKLATSLRSYTVVQDENTSLKASLDKLTADNASLSQQLEIARSQIASLQVQAAATSQIEPLRQELRNSQDEVSRLATENHDLRTRLSLQAPGPGSTKPVPTRPSQVSAAPAAAPETAAPAPEAKTYVVAEGDTLTRISRKFYGTSNRWEDILKANRDILKDEKSLVVGSTLKIP